MNYNEEVPDFLVGLGDMLSADVLKKVNELLEQLYQADKERQSSTVINYYAPGSQHVDKQYNFGEASPQPSPKGKGVYSASPDGHSAPNRGGELPDALATEEAMKLWEKVREAGLVDEDFQPTISRTQAALLAHYMAKKLDIKDKWKTFETLWNRRNMYRDYYDAMNQNQTYSFLDKLKELHD